MKKLTPAGLTLAIFLGGCTTFGLGSGNNNPKLLTMPSSSVPITVFCLAPIVMACKSA